METDLSQRQFEMIKRNFDNELAEIRRKQKRKTALFGTILLATLMLLVFTEYRQKVILNRRINDIETSHEKASQNVTKPYNESSPLGNDSKAAIEARLQALETLQEAMSSTSKGALEQMNFVFSVVAAFFGLFALFFAYRQIVSEAGQERQDSEMLGLVGSFRDNISVVNDLISSMQESFKHQEQLRAQMKNLDNSIEEVKRFKERIVATQAEKVSELNTVAYNLFRDKIDRQSFKEEENRGLLDNFHMNMTALERTGDVSQYFNPMCYVLRALHFFNITQYELAAKDLEEARKICLREIAAPTAGWYSDSTEADALIQVQRLTIDCSYHLGMIYYNVGEYARSRERFWDVVKKSPLDFAARTYIPELMFFDTHVPFSKVVQEYESVQHELESLTLEDKKRVDYAGSVAVMKMKFGNCYYQKRIPLSHRRAYQSDEDRFRALALYREAIKSSQASRLKGSLPEVFMRMSLAQGLEAVGRENWGSDSPTDLYISAFSDLRKIAATKTEPLVIILLSYALAVCAKGGSLSQEDPRTFISRAREYLHRVPAGVNIFSPINKINLSHEQLLWELDEFEKSLN